MSAALLDQLGTTAIKAEMLKLLTTRAIYGLLAGELSVVLLSTTSTVMSAEESVLRGPIHDQVFFLLVSINVGLFSLIIGMRTVTDEYRHSTIAHASLSDPGRRRTVVARAVAGVAAAITLAAISAAIMLGIAVALAPAKGGSLSLGAADVGPLIGLVAANALWAVLGVGVAAVVRQQVAAIVGGLVWILAIENLGAGFLGDASRYLPGQVAYAMASALKADDPLDPATASLTFVVYALAALIAGLYAVRSRDVTTWR